MWFSCLLVFMTQPAGRKEELVTEHDDGFWKISIEREGGREKRLQFLPIFICVEAR
jgi:hypothetical protein